MELPCAEGRKNGVTHGRSWNSTLEMMNGGGGLQGKCSLQPRVECVCLEQNDKLVQLDNGT